MARLEHSVILRGSAVGALALGFLALMGPTRAHAQETALLRGVVAEEESGELIRSAAVTLVGTEMTTRTDADGTFTFLAAPLGRTLVRVQTENYPAVVEEIVIEPGTGNVLPIFLQSAVAALDGILVFGNRPRSNAETGAQSAAELLARKYPEISTFVTKTRSRFPIRLSLRGRNTLGQSASGGEPIVVVDGVRMAGGLGFVLDVLKQIPADDVKTIEILRGTTAAFLYGSADGAIIVETHSRPDAF